MPPDTQADGPTGARPRTGDLSAGHQLETEATARPYHGVRTWHWGEHTRYNPTLARMLDAAAVEKFVLQGWAPPEPPIRRDTRITAIGSAFSCDVAAALSQRGYRVLNAEAPKDYVTARGEDLLTSFAIRQQLEWAWENRTFETELWHGQQVETCPYLPETQAETKRVLDRTEFFILTFAHSEVWYDEPTGDVFWRTIPKDVFDPARHRFRVSTIEENRDNLRAIYRLIRKHRPAARILFSLSPVPMIATFRDNSCLSSNSVSKAILRAAIDEVVREFAAEGSLGYWPAYELLTDVFRQPFRPDRRHPRDRVSDYVTTLFEHVWCAEPHAAPSSLTLAWASACAEAELLPPPMARFILGQRQRRLRVLIRNNDPLHGDEQTDKALRKLGADVLAAWASDATQADAAGDSGDE